MNKTPSSKAKGFSLGTKLILITVLIESMTIAAAVSIAYQFLTTQRSAQYREVLISQTDLISKEVELNRTASLAQSLNKVDLGPLMAFQVLDRDGRVIWDSRDTKRNDTLVLNQHTLFTLAKKSDQVRGSIDYVNSLTQDRFIGAYRKIKNEFLVLGAISKDEIEFEINRTLERFLYLTFLMYGFSFIAIVFFTRRVVSPIHSLTSAARQIADGNFEIEIEKSNGDEIGTLSESFALMTYRIRALLEGEAQKYRMETEVGGVAELQHRLLPKTDIENERYEIRSFYQSATETGGDYWGYLETETHFLIYVGDATGHGLPSAMLTAAARGCFSALQHFYRQFPNQTPTPSEFLTFANQAVLDVSQGELQMTMFVAVYSFSDQTLSFSNAGHNPGWIIRNDQNGHRIETLLSRGPRLGESTHFIADTGQVVPWGANDALFLYSDGLIDCRNELGIELGKGKIRNLILQEVAVNADLANVREKILSLVHEHNQGAVPEDDITFSLLRMRK